jgi:alcohol dehydrogenase class IV
MMNSFETVRRIVFGAGSLENLAEEVRRAGGRRALVVTDPGVRRAGILDAARGVLERAGVAHGVFDGVEADPRIEVAQRAAAAAADFGPDAVVGLGGGSALDIAKLVAALSANEGPVSAYFGMDLLPRPGLPSVLVPTTAGTGSEMTSIAVLSDVESQVKRAVVSPHLFARAALLDPKLTLSLPPAVTATTGMDALVHAVESYVGVRATVFTDTLNHRAIGLAARNLRRAFADGADLEAREGMLHASALAGMAFSNTQNGLAHALALAIGGRHHLPHGLLTAFTLPWVMEFNGEARPEKYAEIARLFGEKVDGLAVSEAARRSVAAIRSLLDDLGISGRLSAYGVPPADFPALAKATLGATRLIGNNPRPVTERDVTAILEANY